MINMNKQLATLERAIENNSNAYFVRHRKHQKISLQQSDSIYFLTKGTVSVYRVRDNVLTITLTAPVPIGLVHIRGRDTQHYIRCNGECDFYVMETASFHAMLTELNLWENVFHAIVSMAHKYLDRDEIAAQGKVQNMIAGHLKLLWSLSEDERSKTSIYSYIMARNTVSRSSMYNVLKEMENLGIIRTFRGKLINFNESELYLLDN